MLPPMGPPIGKPAKCLGRFGSLLAFIFSKGSKLDIVKISKCFKLIILNIFFPTQCKILTQTNISTQKQTC